MIYVKKIYIIYVWNNLTKKCKKNWKNLQTNKDRNPTFYHSTSENEMMYVCMYVYYAYKWLAPGGFVKIKGNVYA